MRELKEETNLDANISHIKLWYFTDDYMQEDMKHYVTFLPILRIFQGELMNMEPHKLEQWEWMDWNDIKYLWEKLFLPIQNFIKKYPDFHPKNI